jgi:hypothetical protein
MRQPPLPVRRNQAAIYKRVDVIGKGQRDDVSHLPIDHSARLPS